MDTPRTADGVALAYALAAERYPEEPEADTAALVALMGEIASRTRLHTAPSPRPAMVASNLVAALATAARCCLPGPDGTLLATPVWRDQLAQLAGYAAAVVLAYDAAGSAGASPAPRWEG